MKNKIIIYQLFNRLFGNLNSNKKFYGTIEENGCGKFNHITSELLREIYSLGVTHIWYTGVLEHATMTDYSSHEIQCDNPQVVKGRAGSPYAIKDYFDVDPDLSENVNERLKEFESLVHRTHDEGMKVIIDFVPNHVSRQYKSDVKPSGFYDLGANDDTSVGFSINNNFYYIPHENFKFQSNESQINICGKGSEYEEFPAKATGNNVFHSSPCESDWYDTVKLNYGIDYFNNSKKYFEPVPDTWLKMRDILLYWSGKKIDGFRCDMAEMVPVEFWQWVIQEIKSEYPEIKFIAESYNPSLYEDLIFTGGFDYLYDKVGLYDSIRALICGWGNVHDVLQRREQILLYQEHMLTFLENHDEQRIASNEFAGNPFFAVPGMVLSAALYKGPVMIYSGQETGELGSENAGAAQNTGRTTIFDYFSMNRFNIWYQNVINKNELNDDNILNLRNFYKRLLNICNESHALACGDFITAQILNKDAFAFYRKSEQQTLLIAVNFSRTERVKFCFDKPEGVVTFRTAFDILSGGREVLTKDKIEFDLAQSDAAIYEFYE